MNIYKTFFRPLLFKTDPEKIHNFSIAAGQKLGKIAPLINIMDAAYHVKDPRLNVQVGSLEFSNPLGLAAGYDKSGHAIRFLESLGFGHVEIGSVSALASEGNPKPRLFRLPADEAIVVHYGLQNEGAEQIANTLKKNRVKYKLGINIVKTNHGIDALPDKKEDIINDYRKSTIFLKDHADYITFNMSCPNTEMGRDFFADKKHITMFLSMLVELELKCPVFWKISPAGGIETNEKYLEACSPYSFDSDFICNLPPGQMVPFQTPEKIWSKMPGAVAGKPVEKILNNSLFEMYKRMDRKKYKLISAGGVFSAEDAYLKIKLGASLVQLLTGMIYLGPSIVKNINKGLIKLLDADGIQTINEATGTAH